MSGSTKKLKRTSKQIGRHENEATMAQKCGRCSRSCSKKEDNSNPGLPQELRKIADTERDLKSKGVIKGRIKPKNSGRKEIMKIRT